MSDDLTRISGVGPAIARALAAAGIASFADLAAVDPNEPPALVGIKGEPDWPDWISQAADLERKQPAPSAADESEMKTFEVASPLLRNGKRTEIGGAVALARPEFELLKASGVVSGDW
jgi:Helix-hairpin-helix domain